ncbi:hypothetical protein L3Q82_004260 [Scortum barcoo]|uniref:Uncharacterized protein n=1 Tax=Scortum barcoo TaxID=214431 RepID=A0ACB8VJA4_9TELE|nr:hypothetical protein L3Q82_004260 [Scortum barcoo]
MRNDVKEYVAAYTNCAPNKTSQHKMGLLETLPVPSHPCSYISLNFFTDLPASRGNTTVLTVVDRLMKMAHFIALPKLPSAKETVELCYTMLSVFTVSLETLNGGERSSHASGKISAVSSVNLSANLLATTPYPMDRQRD